jgi:hypothetical protein
MPHSPRGITYHVIEERHMSNLWQISGRVEVEESATTVDARGTSITRSRPLAGILVELTATDGGRQTIWARATTDAWGRFHVRAHAPHRPHAFRVLARFAGERLVVTDSATDGVLQRDWLELLVTELDIVGPSVDLGVLTFRRGAEGVLGETGNVRRAATWYVAHAAMDYLAQLGDGLGFAQRLAFVYPAPKGDATSSVDARTRVARIVATADRDEWSVDLVLEQLMTLWALREDDGTTRWPRLARGQARLQLTTDGAPVTEHTFAGLARDELLAAIWGRRTRMADARPFLDAAATTATHPLPRLAS